MKKIRVLIIDDSALVRKLLTDILSSDPAIEIAGTAPDPFIARDKIKQLNPDVLTLDVEMPKMDGVTFLRNLMRLRPMPVVMVSTLTEKGADVTLEALELGAIDFVTKPKLDLTESIKEYTEEIIAKVKIAASVRVQALNRAAAPVKRAATGKQTQQTTAMKKSSRHFKTTDRIIAIGASTGGTEAIKDVLMRLPPNCPGVVIAQHIPEAFSAPFAKRMDSVSAMNVCEARDGQQILPGHVYIAPGSHHLELVRDGARYICRLSDADPVNRHRPSVEVLFRSVCEHAGQNAIGVMLTGMGADGAEGMVLMHQAGAYTIAQDERTSVVWGMPGEAVKRNCVDSVLPLQKIADRILDAAEDKVSKTYSDSKRLESAT
jgi:two-component system chemotaxis response regulator CheB